MKKSKIIFILTALLFVTVVCFAVYVTADSTNTVKLVTLDYIENTVMSQVDDKIKTDSPKAMQETVDAINGAVDRLSAEIANGKISDSALADELNALLLATDDLRAQIEASNYVHTALAGGVNNLQASLKELRNQILDTEGTLSGLQTAMNALADRLDALEESFASLATSKDGYVKVVLCVGDSLGFANGATAEIVLVAGELTVQVEKGIMDLTAGEMAAPFSLVAPGHHLVVFAGNANSLLATTEDAIILVKGEYEIVKQS